MAGDGNVRVGVEDESEAGSWMIESRVGLLIEGHKERG